MEQYEIIQNEILDLIKKRRHQLLISQHDLAEMVGISYIHLARIERGEYFPQFKILIKILEALGLRLEINLK